MVVRRTVHHLRQRPRHEREAVAAWIAIGVVIVLFLLWMVFFFRGIRSASLQSQNAPTAVEPAEQLTQTGNQAAAAQTQIQSQPQIIQVSSSTDYNSP